MKPPLLLVLSFLVMEADTPCVPDKGREMQVLINKYMEHAHIKIMHELEDKSLGAYIFCLLLLLMFIVILEID